jgi:type I restriction enzyme S subunit
MSDWLESSLGDLSLTLRSGGTPTAGNDEFYGGDIPFVTIEDMTACSKHLGATKKYLTRKGLANSASWLVPKGHILYSMYATLGKARLNTFPVATNQAIAALRPDPSRIDIEYLLYFLAGLEGQIHRFSSQTTQSNLNAAIIRGFRISFPQSLNEQRKIARILTTVDNLIEKTEALIAKYQAIKQGMMHDLFTRGVDEHGHLRPPYEEAPELYKQSELGWIPKEWEIGTIASSAIEVIDGDRGSNYPTQDEFTSEGFCLFLSATNVTKTGFVFESMQFISQEKDECLGTGKLRRNDVVVTTRGTVGNIAYYDDTVPFSDIRLNSGMLILRNNDSEMSSRYFYHSYKNYLFRREYERVVSGSAQPQLPSRDLKKFRVVKPSPAEQEIVSQRVEAVESYLRSEMRSLTKCHKQKTGLMQDLLTGKVRVKVDDAEEAAAHA